ncbi:hypothetical protein KDA_46260 [Dictyobacter alpinus]|uniref:ATP-grasp domain-containing protein n=1 Tax=Dictyobacter alpinus TaxID=2014873 RepID=A0A402BCY4_9CHLR|nr:STM4014 family protein [Dictyobacter alpinus]GCE29142.1 hypothetical protein KDA_46260 [Dictyobacter alpinus]
MNQKPPFLVIGTPGDRRIDLFQQALLSSGEPEARLISYLDLLQQRTSLSAYLSPETIVRIESPGKNQQVERALLTLGAELEDPEGVPYQRLSTSLLAALPFEKGLLLPSRQWYLGYKKMIGCLHPQLLGVRLFNQPEDILLMFDKRACHRFLALHAIPVPPALDPISCYEELRQQMIQRHWPRVFIKPAHGSSAAGIIAYRCQGTRQQAITTIEMVSDESDGYRLYNTRRIRTYSDAAQIEQLINALCLHRVHVEQWIPKAGYQDQVFDCRIVVINGQAQHAVVRLSHSPMTNLHLLNQRGDLNVIRQQLGEDNWQAALHTCERAAALFPKSLYVGVDLLFAAHHPEHHAILEMNAFGDLLPRLLCNGQDTYSAELAALLKGSSDA